MVGGLATFTKLVGGAFFCSITSHVSRKAQQIVCGRRAPHGASRGVEHWHIVCSMQGRSIAVLRVHGEEEVGKKLGAAPGSTGLGSMHGRALISWAGPAWRLAGHPWRDRGMRVDQALGPRRSRLCSFILSSASRKKVPKAGVTYCVCGAARRRRSQRRARGAIKPAPCHAQRAGQASGGGGGGGLSVP